MTGQGITCVAGGSLTAALTRLTVLDHPAGRAVAAALPSHTWCVETAARAGSSSVISHPGRSSPCPAVTTRRLSSWPRPRARHHWRIIPHPERRSAVIISRVTGLALTAGSPDAGRSAPVGLTAYL
jgi:hypothetical protein